MNTPRKPSTPVCDGYIGGYKQQVMRKLSGLLRGGQTGTFNGPVMACDPSPFKAAA